MTYSVLTIVLVETLLLPDLIGAQAPATNTGVPHPSVQFAARLLKDGQVEEAIATLRPRVDADPNDCQALGLMVVGSVQQREHDRARTWLERLQGVSACAATAAAAARVMEASTQRAALAQSLAVPIVSGDLKKIDEEVGRAEQTLGPLPAVRAYVDALKGEFPLLKEGAPGALPSALATALRKRQSDYDTAMANQNGSDLMGWTHGPLNNLDPMVRAAWESEGYRVGHDFITAGKRQGAATAGAYQKAIAWYADQIRALYGLSPLNESTLTNLMTLAFLSGSPEQIESVASTMRRAFQRVSWFGEFQYSDEWTMVTQMTIDFNDNTLTYAPLSILGAEAKPPAELRNGWTFPLSQVQSMSQPDIKFGRLRETGYRAMGPAEQGILVNGRMRVPLPAHMFYVGVAYTEIPVRQAIREYGTQVARMLKVPDTKVKLVEVAPGKGLFSFLQIWAAASEVVSEATGRSIISAPLADLTAQMGQQAAFQQQVSSQAMNVWERAKLDPLLGQALTIDDLAADIDRLLEIATTASVQ